jgi:hypothetical protein
VTLNLLNWIHLLCGALLGELALSAYPIILGLPPSGPFDLELPNINFEHLLRRRRLYRFLSEDLIEVFQKVVGTCRLPLVMIEVLVRRSMHELRVNETEILTLVLRLLLVPA